MIIDRLTLNNFGIYHGRQVVELTPPSPEQPVILFGGLNGGGKTTILDALQLVLFGPQARCSNRGSLSYQDFLLASIHRHATSSQAALTLEFRHTRDGDLEHFRLQRSWSVVEKGAKEVFEVIRDGQLDRAMTENWLYQVEDFIPLNISHLFLFDGEKIEGYAAPESSTALIRTAIQNLLGLDVVDQLEKDIQTLGRRKRAAAKDSETQSQIERCEAMLKATNELLATRKQDRASYRSHFLDRTQKRFAEVDARYRQLGGDLFDQRTDLEMRKDEAVAAAEAGAQELRELAAGALPFVLVSDLLGAVAERDHQEHETLRSREVLSVLEERDEALLAELNSVSGKSDLVEWIDRFLSNDRRCRQIVSESAVYLELAREARTQLSLLRQHHLPEARAKATEAQKSQHFLQEALESAELAFASIPAVDVLAPLIKERDQLGKQLDAEQKHYDAMGVDLDRIKREIERAEQTLIRLLETNVQASVEHADRQRFFHHADKVQRTLQTFRQQVIERHVRRIEQLVLESFQQLLRKTSLVAGLAIDPDNFVLTLYGPDCRILTPDRLSAGERQLLAVALLWGLAKASGRPLPTAIDTPLGRLDAEHRAHLVERYFPHASHQVLLLSTDEEITGDYLERLRPWIGRTYALRYNDEEGSTVIEPGYFDEPTEVAAHVN